MDRRTFLATIAGGLLAAPLAGQAERARKLPRVGHLSSLDRPTVNFAAFQDKLTSRLKTDLLGET